MEPSLAGWVRRGARERTWPGAGLIRGLVFLLGVAGCAYEPTDMSSRELGSGEMLVYKVGQAVPESELVDLGAPSELGGTVLGGEPAISARIDYSAHGVTAGVFQATRGEIWIHFPFTEHATIIKGQVKMTDEFGNSHVFKPGDSYLIRQGSNIHWDVNGPMVQKSFFHRVEPFDSPGPMVVYRKGRGTPEEELVDLGDPEALGGTVLEGDVSISARVDISRDDMVGGVFQATRGDVLIEFPFTEHATITKGAVRLTDDFGTTHVFQPGDSYLIKQTSPILWEVNGARVQKSFLHVF